MKFFYDINYNIHTGFQSSFECSNRVTKTIKKIDCEPVCGQKYRPLPMEWERITNKIEEKYKNIKTINCHVCSFTNKAVKTCEICGSKLGTVKLVSSIDGDTTYMCKDSSKTVTSLLKTIMISLDWQTDRIEKKKAENVFIITRPPGHHSDNIDPQGFCLVNNMYMAVDYLRKQKGIKKIAIVDWDVHHGNGTQKLFYEDNKTLFIDLHRDNFYPRTGSVEETGKDDGVGYTINIPLEKGSDEAVYIKHMMSDIIPALVKFDPDWIMVSCGFDAHINDPFGGMKLTDTSYGKFHHILKSMNKPMTYLLEGGYDADAISLSIAEIRRRDITCID